MSERDRRIGLNFSCIREGAWPEKIFCNNDQYFDSYPYIIYNHGVGYRLGGLGYSSDKRRTIFCHPILIMSNKRDYPETFYESFTLLYFNVPNELGIHFSDGDKCSALLNRSSEENFGLLRVGRTR